MSDLEEFEDWSHPTRALTLPRRRRPIGLQCAFWAVLLLCVGLSVTALWYAVHVIRDAYRVVFGS